MKSRLRFLKNTNPPQKLKDNPSNSKKSIAKRPTAQISKTKAKSPSRATVPKKQAKTRRVQLTPSQGEPKSKSAVKLSLRKNRNGTNAGPSKNITVLATPRLTTASVITTDKGKTKTSPLLPKSKFTRRRSTNPHNTEQYFELSPEAQEQWNRVAHVIQKVRTERVSVTQAAKEFGIDRKKVIQLGGSALRKQKNGRYKAKSFDRLLRVLVIPSSDGLKEVAVRDSRTASKIAEYSNAVHRFLQTGDASRLRTFRKLKINDASGNPIKLLTDTNELTRIGLAGVLSFESLYARVA